MYTLPVKSSRNQIKKYARRQRLGVLEQEILEKLSVGDFVVGALLSAHSTKRMYQIAGELAKKRYQARLVVERLVEEGYIKDKHERLSISVRGRELLRQKVIATNMSLTARTWDGKWRMVAFDIPTQHKKTRDALRFSLKRAGFVQLQQSVWVFPHECEEFVQLLKKHANISSYILYGVLEKIENDASLRKKFSLNEKKTKKK